MHRYLAIARTGQTELAPFEMAWEMARRTLEARNLAFERTLAIRRGDDRKARCAIQHGGTQEMAFPFGHLRFLPPLVGPAARALAPAVANACTHTPDDAPGYAPAGELAAAFGKQSVRLEGKGKHVAVQLSGAFPCRRHLVTIPPL